MDQKHYEELAAKVRIDVIRAIHSAGSGHPGGSLSAADIVTALYFKEMNIDPADQQRQTGINSYCRRTCRPCPVCGSGRAGILSCQRNDDPA